MDLQVGVGVDVKKSSVMYINYCLNFDVPNWMFILNSSEGQTMNLDVIYF